MTIYNRPDSTEYYPDEIRTDNDRVSALEDIQERLRSLVSDAEDILEDAEPSVQARAQAYWLGHLRNWIGDDGCNPYDHTIQKTIDELDKCHDCDVSFEKYDDDGHGVCTNCGDDE